MSCFFLCKSLNDLQHFIFHNNLYSWIFQLWMLLSHTCTNTNTHKEKNHFYLEPECQKCDLKIMCRAPGWETVILSFSGIKFGPTYLELCHAKYNMAVGAMLHLFWRYMSILVCSFGCQEYGTYGAVASMAPLGGAQILKEIRILLYYTISQQHLQR